LYYLLMTTSRQAEALELITEMGIVRPVDLEERGISRGILYRLVRDGLVERQTRGIYVAIQHPFSAEHSLAHVAKRVPAAVFCLLTALRFHELTTQNPAEVWIALPEKARKPRLEYPRIRIARFSLTSLNDGVETHHMEWVKIRVYGASKTVADCFKYRNKLGIDVAVEALRDYLRNYRGQMDELAHFAGVCRVSRVMQPYLDSVE
jgi:predicted transcriptional regulator of viral defense system